MVKFRPRSSYFLAKYRKFWYTFSVDNYDVIIIVSLILFRNYRLVVMLQANLYKVFFCLIVVSASDNQCFGHC